MLNELFQTQKLQLVGGKNKQHTIRNVMKMTFGENIVSNYTWHGLRNKKSLKDSEVAKCIVSAMAVTNISEYETSNVAGDWLWHYSDRLNNKKKCLLPNGNLNGFLQFFFLFWFQK